MGIFTLQFGQCGNQTGHSLFTYLANDIKYNCNNVTQSINSDYAEKSCRQWFYEKKTNYFVPRSVLIDTENKVISNIIKNADLLKYKNVIAKSDGGSANNWAYGFNYTGPGIKNDVLGIVRKEIEKCDEVIQFFNILGSAGGTGSGVGSCIIESLRDEYPNKTIINALVLPYSSGEVVTQNYNTLLTLAKLHDITDGNIIFENDPLHKTCKELLAVQNVEFKLINSVIAQKISAVFQPLDGDTITNFVSQLALHPSYKFVQVKTTPHIPDKYMKFETEHSWSRLIGHIRNILQLNSQYWENKQPIGSSRTYPENLCSKSVGNLLIARGGKTLEPSLLTPLLEDKLYASWLPRSARLKTYYQIRNLYNTQNFLTLATNNNLIYKTFESIIEQAWTLYNNKAYLHQYEKYDITETEFDTAFEKLESVVSCYKNL